MFLTSLIVKMKQVWEYLIYPSKYYAKKYAKQYVDEYTKKTKSEKIILETEPYNQYE